ncbi:MULTISPECIES: helix-turn-helix transcriptional regulator [unclassified Thioalkalivibrio]|uniref:helix-turn-helix domain-containing protein n=1 Tax=unclassified Thioalkalivibrio TaxID=2621013 RepID=UPI00037F1569|nr:MULTISPECIES: helix-turn-helix transcriptional regulator [unclassified Thioalkalivibrio]
MAIRIKLKELVAEKEYQEGRVVTFKEIAEEAGVHRVTLSKIANNKGYNVGTDTLDRLCKYFGCRIEELVEFIDEDEASQRS